MPLIEDRVRTLEARAQLPEGSAVQLGTYVTYLGTDEDGDPIYDLTSVPEGQVIEGHGDPNGAYFANIGRLFVDQDVPTLWINADSQDTWTEVGTATVDGDTYVDDGNVTGSTTVSYTTAHVHKLTLTGNITLTLSGATAGVACGLTLYLFQDGSGSHLVTWPGSVKWPLALAPTLSTAASKIDIVVLESFDGGTSWYANLAGKAYA